MLEGKDLILATRKYAVEDKAKSWFHMLSSYSLLLLAFTLGILSQNLLIKTGLAVLSGLMVVRVFVIYHDYLHKAILTDSRLARFLFYIFGLFILAPFSIWRRSHDYHHKHNSKLYTSSIGSFPIVTLEKYRKAGKGERRTYLFIRHPLTICLGYIFAFVYGMCIRSISASFKKHWDSALALLFHFGLAWMIYWGFGLSTVLISFFLPLFIACGMGSYLFYAQHNFPSVRFTEKEDWSYTEAALKSSSMMDMNPLMRFFTANIGYHHIHHVNARIPFYRLPEVYRDMAEFQDPGRTSLSFKDVMACFRLKVWDPKLGRMIGHRELSLS